MTTKIINIKQLPLHLQKDIKAEVAGLNLKQSKRKVVAATELSEAAKAWLDQVVKGTWTQRPDGKIDVKGSVWASFNEDIHLLMGKEIFFGEVRGIFNCNYTKITSLKGVPEKIGGGFGCSFTDITSLEGAPRVVGGDFYCSNTKITSLEGAPKEVGEYFYCDYIHTLTSLKGAPEKVGGDFTCRCTKITSLEGIGEVRGKIYSDLE